MGRELEVTVQRDILRAFSQPKRHKVAKGGRGSAKSQSICRMLVARQIERPQLWLCTRQVQKSIKNSVHKLLSDTIQSLNLGYYFDVQATEIKRHGGGGFQFSGLQDHTVDSIKSFEGCDGAWVEEAHGVAQRSAEVLIPTIRKEGSEIWWSYNPDLEDDYVHQRFVVRGDPNAVVVTVNWRDNPWFPSVLELERQELLRVNDDLYQHVWEGQCRSLAGLLFKRKWFRRYDTLPDRLSLYMASDYATGEADEESPDPDFTSHGLWGLDEHGDLYAVDWWSEQADPDVWITAAANLAKRHKPRMWFEEKGVIRRAINGALTKTLRERDIFVHREALASAGSKSERALGFAARASVGAVLFPATPKNWNAARDGKHWSDRVIDQLCGFTGQEGKHDDDVDVCSLVSRGLDRMTNPRPEPKQDQPSVKPFSRAHIEAGERAHQISVDERKRHYR